MAVETTENGLAKPTVRRQHRTNGGNRQPYFK
jgi:hypothetical protein